MKIVKKLKPFHVDERGEMTHLLDGELKIVGALLITCKKGAIRANHYHTHDTHYAYILSGSMEYVYQDMHKENSHKHSIIVKTGELVMTPPKIAHAMRFLEDSMFIALTTEERDQASYEKDTKKIKLI